MEPLRRSRCLLALPGTTILEDNIRKRLPGRRRCLITCTTITAPGHPQPNKRQFLQRNRRLQLIKITTTTLHPLSGNMITTIRVQLNAGIAPTITGITIMIWVAVEDGTTNTCDRSEESIYRERKEEALLCEGFLLFISYPILIHFRRSSAGRTRPFFRGQRASTVSTGMRFERCSTLRTPGKLRQSRGFTMWTNQFYGFIFAKTLDLESTPSNIL